MIYRNNMKNREFDKEGAVNLDQAKPTPKQVDLHKSIDAGGSKVTGCPTPSKTDSSCCFGINYCKAGRRFVAYLVDVCVQLALLALCAFLLEQQSFIGMLNSGLLLFVIAWLYFALMESSKYQATLGKKLMKIKVVDLNGERISFSKATGRFFGKLLSRLLLGLGFLMMLFTKKRQCLHDKMTATVVIKH